MIAPDFTETSLRALLECVSGYGNRTKDRTTSLCNAKNVDKWQHRPKNPIYLRFDIDDDLRKAVKMADICYSLGINATFFILNTAKYWSSPGLMNELKFMQDSLGQEIGWHNNILTEWIKQQQTLGDFPNEDPKSNWIANAIDIILSRFREHAITIRGSASHGDLLCRKLNYLNYEVFTECPRTQEAVNFPPCSFTIPKVSMHDFGFEYEAYHVPYDLYLSESGGREWTARRGESQAVSMPIEKSLAVLDSYDRIQILIHPQHWKI